MAAVHPSTAGLLSEAGPRALEVRRLLHRRPELAFGEFETAALVAGRLEALGLVVRRGVGGTGVVADLEGARPGRTLLLRADLDALPISERTGSAWASEREGLMHACGHDFHSAALLAVAEVLSACRGSWPGRVRFCFQPAEEILQGASAMLAEGVMAGVDEVAGAHVDAYHPLGTVLARAGDFLAGGDFFRIAVRGGAGHAALPHLGADPIYAACQMVTALQAIVARETPAGVPLVISVGGIEAGRAANIVLEEVVVHGTVRWFDQGLRDRALARIEAIASGVGASLGAHAGMTVTGSAPVVVNSVETVETLRTALAGVATVVDPGRLMVSDDVALMLERAPGVYFLVGGGGSGLPHHHPGFEVDEGVLAVLTECLVLHALARLRGD